jgi:glycosyltransferase involved in cell wall biosynthesis
MKASVIIPTLNEEQSLPNLLTDLNNQTVRNFEIIVADAGSRDRTRAIAQSYYARVVEGGLPAVGRNKGARAATGEFLFFLDADVQVPPTFMANASAEIDDRFLDLATCEIVPLSDRPIDKFLHEVVNAAIKLGQFLDPHAPGFCILVSKRLFHRIGGFDETLKLAEDHNFAKRASQFRPLRVLESTRIGVSVRRLDKERRGELIRKYLQVELYRIFRGEIRDDIIPYEFGNFSGSEKKFSEKELEEGHRLIDRINRSYQQFVADFQEDYPRTTSAIEEGLDRLKEQFEDVRQYLKSILTLPPKKP